MSFAFIFDKEEDTYQFSYCYPYSYSRLQNYLDNLEKRNMEFFSRELLCLTVVSSKFLAILAVLSEDVRDTESQITCSNLKNIICSQKVYAVLKFCFCYTQDKLKKEEKFPLLKS